MPAPGEIYILHRDQTNSIWERTTLPYSPNKVISTGINGNFVLSEILDSSYFGAFTSSYYNTSASFDNRMLVLSSSISNISSSNSLTASYVDYSNIANKPSIISSSAQIAPQITASFQSVSSSFNSRILPLETFSSSFSSQTTLGQITASTLLVTGSAVFKGSVTMQSANPDSILSSAGTIYLQAGNDVAISSSCFTLYHVSNSMTSSLSPHTSSLVHNTDTNTIDKYDGKNWMPITSTSSHYGKSKTIETVLWKSTTSATPTELFLDGISKRLIIETNTVLSAVVDITGVDNAGNACNYWMKMILRNVNGSTSSYGTTIGSNYESVGGNAWSIQHTNNALTVIMTSLINGTSTYWRWSAKVSGIVTSIGSADEI